MANDFRSARFWAQELIEKALFDGARAVDATMGNGHDAQWLCELVGESGRVFAFDVQPEAVARTRQRLTDAGLRDHTGRNHAGRRERGAGAAEGGRPADHLRLSRPRRGRAGTGGADRLGERSRRKALRRSAWRERV